MKLSDVIDVFIAGDWGNTNPSKETSNAVYCVRGADIMPIFIGEFREIPLRYVCDKSLEEKTLHAGDMIIEKSGGSPTQSTGRIAYVTEDLITEKGAVVCTNFCVAFRVKAGWNPYFVYQYWNHIYNNNIFFNFEGKTSGLKNLQLDNALKAIEIPDYTLEQQNRIAETLLKIEQKVRLNRQINHNLEAIIADTMDYMFLSNIHLMSKRLVGDIAVIKAGGDCPTEWSKCRTDEYNTPIYSNGTDNEGLYGYAKEAVVSERSITIAARGTIGYCILREGGYIPIIRLLAVTPNDIGGDVYLHQIFNRIKFKNDGSIQQQLTVPSLASIEIPYPNTSELMSFANKTYPIIDKIKQNKQQIGELIKQRDELLPLLMNGQVSVNYDFYGYCYI